MSLEAAVVSRTPADMVCCAGVGVGDAVGVGVGETVGVGVGEAVGVGVGAGVGVFVSAGSVGDSIQGAACPQPPQKFPVFPVLPHFGQSQEDDSAETANDKASITKSRITEIAFLIKQCICAHPFLEWVPLFPVRPCRAVLIAARPLMPQLPGWFDDIRPLSLNKCQRLYALRLRQMMEKGPADDVSLPGLCRFVPQ